MIGFHQQELERLPLPYGSAYGNGLENGRTQEFEPRFWLGQSTLLFSDFNRGPKQAWCSYLPHSTHSSGSALPFQRLWDKACTRQVGLGHPVRSKRLQKVQVIHLQLAVCILRGWSSRRRRSPRNRPIRQRSRGPCPTSVW